MSRAKELFKNIVALTLGQMGTKIISFLLIPLYTNILTTGEYGIYDLINTTVGLLIPFMTLNIKDSTMRFALDKDYDKSTIFSISLKYCVRTIIISFIFIEVNSIFKVFSVVDDYKIFVFSMFVLSAVVDVLSCFVRGLDRLSDIAIAGVIGSSAIIVLNIVFLIPLKLGLQGYFLAHILGTLLQCAFLFCRNKLWRFIKLNKVYDNAVKKEMVSYSVPLIANSAAWWVNSVSDRYIVTWICGVSITGIYSIAGKIPTIIDVLQNIFSQAWTIFVIKNIDSNDREQLIKKSYEIYSTFIIIICSILIMLSKVLSSLLYAKEFFGAWKYVPFLLIASTCGAMSGYFGGVFAAVKESKIFAYSTVLGAMVNLLLNVLLVYRMGALGAAIATVVSCFVILFVRIFYVKRIVQFETSVKRDALMYLILIIQAVSFLLVDDIVPLYVIQILCLVTLFGVFKNELLYLIKAVKGLSRSV